MTETAKTESSSTPLLNMTLYPGSQWTCDHGDTARSKYTSKENIGLPKSLCASSKMKIQRNVPSPDIHANFLWMYTRKPDELYAFQGRNKNFGSNFFKFSMVKLNSRTLKIEKDQIFYFPFDVYIGGALMHGNGHVYVAQGGIIYKFQDGDLTKVSKRLLYNDVKGGNRWLTQSNGLLVTSTDKRGFLVIKVWSVCRRDLKMLIPFMKMLLIVGSLTLYALSAMFGKAIGITLFIGLYMYMDFPIPTWSIGPEENLSSIYILDPETLETVDCTKVPDRIAFARMAMARCEDTDKEGEWLTVLGDSTIMRYHISPEGKVTADPKWSSAYRKINDEQSFPGTGPCIYKNTVAFTENTFPFFKDITGYRFYTKSLDSSESKLQALDLAPGPKAGFMFWSTVADPVNDAFIVWDIHAPAIISIDRQTLKQNWNVPLRCYDCVTVAADKGHVYVTHHELNLKTLLDHVTQLTSPVNKKKAMKEFVILDLKTGDIIKRVDLGVMVSCSSVLMPGTNNDVFCASSSGVCRIYIDDSSEEAQK